MSLDSLRKIGLNKKWREVTILVTAGHATLPSSVEDFGTYWIEAGHKMREQIDDDQRLCLLLRTVLPHYVGEDQALYRGENRSRFDRGTIGLNWTTEINVARMFAGGLNAIDGGGVLLKAQFPARKIIAGPNSHSVYLQEYQFTVEPPTLQEIELLEVFPQL